MLRFSKTNTKEKDFESADLNVLLANVQNEIRETIEEKKAIITSEKLPVARVISFQFHQLLENLLLNSLKYNKPGVPPEINIFCKTVDFDEHPPYDALENGSYYLIEIKDNGIGFEQEHNQRIFELFQRLHVRIEYPGTGLGLSICKKIMQNHRGAITANGVPGQGATFTLYLPV